MTKTGYKTIGDLKMYYEIHGETHEDKLPLLLLHGEFATADMFGELLPALKGRQVIVPEQQAHGHTIDIDRPLSFRQMAEDTAELLKQLNIEKVDVLGYSGGGSVALHLAVYHPEMVGKLALASAAYSLDAYYPEITVGLQNPDPDAFPPELREAYDKAAPLPENWDQLVYKTADMANTDSKMDVLTEAQLKGITCPVLLIVGDQDIIQPEYAEHMAALLHTDLVMVPGDHASYIAFEVGPLVEQLKPFFDL